MIDNLLRNTKRDFTIFDFETNGLNLRRSLPWQLAWVRLNKYGIKQSKNRYLYYKNYQISDQVAAINHFKRDEYEAQATNSQSNPRNVIREFFQDWKDSYAVGHNIIRYDNWILNSICLDLGIQIPANFFKSCVDTIAIEKCIQKEGSFEGQDPLLAQIKWSGLHEKGMKTSQGFLLKKYNIDHNPEKLHDAEYDTLMNGKILEKQLETSNMPDFLSLTS